MVCSWQKKDRLNRDAVHKVAETLGGSPEISDIIMSLKHKSDDCSSLSLDGFLLPAESSLQH